ncbi:hypothetical protein N8706_00665 [Flavobacteriaceae bacterium]|nr:hypothetical protein [Flavobacteriaceae bacterium]
MFPHHLLPPSPALAVKAYCLTICVGGVFGAWESSLAHVRINSKDKYKNIFFTFKFITKEYLFNENFNKVIKRLSVKV